MTLSPSSAARRVACQGSHLLEQKYPRQEQSVSAREGEQAHELAAQALRGSKSPGENHPVEMVQAVNLYVENVRDAVINIGSPQNQLIATHIEQLLTIGLIHKECKGTPDAWFYDNNDVYIWDFKYGHTPVEVEKNWQLIEYAAGVIEKLPHYQDNRLSDLTFHLRIVQPRAFHRDGPIREWVVGFEELWEYVEFLRGIEENATIPGALCTPNPQCNFCRARHVCPALQATTLAMVDVSKENQPNELTPAMVGNELLYLKRAHKLLDARITGLEQQAIAQIKRGDFVPHYMLEAGRGRKRWEKSTSEVIALGELMGVPLAKPIEVITPTQAIAAGLPAEVVDGYSETLSGELKLVEIKQEAVSKIFQK